MIRFREQAIVLKFSRRSFMGMSLPFFFRSCYIAFTVVCMVLFDHHMDMMSVVFVVYDMNQPINKGSNFTGVFIPLVGRDSPNSQSSLY